MKKGFKIVIILLFLMFNFMPFVKVEAASSYTVEMVANQTGNKVIGKYSSYSSDAPRNRPYKDRETETLGNPTSWSAESKVDTSNQEYRLEERKIMTRFRVQYETVSLKVLSKPLTRNEFEEKVKMSIPEFASNENYKLEVTYKFKYRKSWFNVK